MHSAINCHFKISINDINESNLDMMLDKVLELANNEMAQQIKNYDSGSDSSDNSSTMHSSNSEGETSNDDSSEFDEEYSFDNVRRVTLSNRGRRVSIYDMEFDEDVFDKNKAKKKLVKDDENNLDEYNMVKLTIANINNK